MKRILLFSLILSFFATAEAQFVEVSYGASYTQQVYYNLTTDAKTPIKNNEWDIAISTNQRDVAIHLNEAAGTQEEALELYFSPTADFADVIDPATLTLQLFNPDKSWSVGAFNSIAQPGNPFDFGWGTYDPSTFTVNGTAIFGYKKRDGSWKKLMIESLAGATFTIKMADLDGANEQVYTFDMTAYTDRKMVFYSFETEKVVDISTDFDLVFSRYYSPASDGTGTILDYSVSGVLSGFGIEVAQADDIAPSTVEFAPFQDSLTTDIDAIGFDWKEINLTTFAWNLDPHRAYFVKKANNDVWKVVFIDFEGSSTGNLVFEKTLMGNIGSTNLEDVTSAFSGFNVFPNPVQTEATIAFSLKNSGNINLTLTSVLGQQVWNHRSQATEGFNVVTMPDLNAPAGTYFLNLQAENGEVISKKISVQ